MRKKTAYLGMFLAAALICSYIETLLPVPLGIPGVKLGLANIVVVLMLYLIGAREALAVLAARIVLVGFLFGSLFGICYSFAGGILSFAAMYIMKRTDWFQIITVSVAGGLFHNIGQLLLAAVIVENYGILYYIPVLILSGAVTGCLIGLLARELIVRLKDQIRF